MYRNMEVNEFLIQFRGKAIIDRPLQFDRDYDITSRVSVAQVKEVSNGDGSTDKIYVVEPIVSEIKNDRGEAIQFKKKSKMSQALRMMVIGWMRDNRPEIEDDDKGYEIFMSRLLEKFDGLATLVMKDDVG